MTFSFHLPREGLVTIDKYGLEKFWEEAPKQNPTQFSESQSFNLSPPQGKDKENKPKRNNRNKNHLLIPYFLPELKITEDKEINKK